MTYAFIGLMVLYRLTEDDAKKTNMRREDARQKIEKMREENQIDPRPGFQCHVGNFVDVGDHVPMVVTMASAGIVNGKAFLDGNDTLWVVGAIEGGAVGEWEPITNG